MLKVGLIGICLVAASQSVLAEDEFEASSDKFLMFEIRTTQPENDALLDATCLASNMIDIRFGGGFDFGKGKYEPVSLKLSDGTLSSRIKGISVLSPDHEMTGGSMLLTALDPKGKEMQILASGKPIEFRPSSGAPGKVTLGKTVTAAVKTFVKNCIAGNP